MTLSWGESWNKANEENCWVERVIRCLEHPMSSVTPQQVEEILARLFDVPPENREDCAAELMAKVILSKYN